MGTIASVSPCPEPQAAIGACSQAALIGTATIAAGAGTQPLNVSGPVYLTGPYDGAPFGLAIVVDAVAGPFDLGTVIVRSRITVDPSDLALTVATSSLPQIVGGVPLRVRVIDVTLDRPGFMLNPTNCEPQAITATVDSTEGVNANLSEHFQVAGCGALKFAPRLAAKMPAKASRTGNGAGMSIEIVEPATSNATIRSVTIQLPRYLRPRLTTIQHACLVTTETSSLSGCPAQSIVGHATVDTSILPMQLSGVVYLVAHGGSARPSLVLLLEGGGIDVHLEGESRISRTGVIKTVFADLPPVPITSFEIALPGGPFSILGAVNDPCRQSLILPYELVDQSGAAISRTTDIAVTGCPKNIKRKDYK